METVRQSRDAGALFVTSPVLDLNIVAFALRFPRIPLAASGGVNQQTAAEFTLAGAVAIGVGTELTPKKAVRRRD
jgi:2-keto-3-deoxy-6-phosphogluconate aldolase